MHVTAKCKGIGLLAAKNDTSSAVQQKIMDFSLHTHTNTHDSKNQKMQHFLT